MLPVNTNSSYAQPIVASPLHYLNAEQKQRKFTRLDECRKAHLTALLQYTSPGAILDKIPTLTKYRVDQIPFTILNYTDEPLRFIKGEYFTLCTAREPVIYFNESTHLVAYKVANLPHIICLEGKNNEANEDVIQRYFIIEDESGHHGFTPDLQLPEWLVNNKDLLMERPIKLDAKALIKKDPGLQMLVRAIPREALKTENPSLLQFNRRKNIPNYTILNYTDRKISVDLAGIIRVNGAYFTGYPVDDTHHYQLIACPMQYHNGTIYFQEKCVDKENLHPPFIYQDGIDYQADVTVLPPTLEDVIYNIRKIDVLKTYWTGIIADENSDIYNLLFPAEIIGLIFHKYLNC